MTARVILPLSQFYHGARASEGKRIQRIRAAVRAAIRDGKLWGEVYAQGEEIGVDEAEWHRVQAIVDGVK